jgi:nucleotide-binding universal stress UspA family protein
MKILIAVDEKIFADAICQFVINHQWASAPEIKILHVVEPIFRGNYMSVLPKEVIDDLVEEEKSFSKDLVRKAALKLRDAFHTTHIEEAIVDGHPKEEIVRQAIQWGADLLIVGSHGRGAMNKFILGSVSQAVAASAPMAVLIIRPEQAAQKQEPVASLTKERVL